jgi:pimeloyl-ACP methyl ester carboxylesterase
VLLAFVVFLWAKSPGKPDPIVDKDGKEVRGSISTIEEIVLGGQKQYMIIRGSDASLPVMLFLHGGPGSPELPFMKHYNREIEKDFVMVYWEQRGAGKSFSRDIPSATMNMEQFIADTRELSEYLIERFGQEKIYLMGHSWGSLLGIMTAYQYPKLYHAYFGVGQVANQYRSEEISFQWVQEQAQMANDEKAIRQLAELNFPDTTASAKDWVDFLMHERQYVMQYGGSMRELSSMWPMVKMLMNSQEYTLGEKVKYMEGNLYSLENMWEDVMTANLFNDIDSMQVPVYIFQGQYDYQTAHAVAKDFYDQLKAPKKDFFTFEHSAHSPLMEEVEKFNALVRDHAGVRE